MGNPVARLGDTSSHGGSITQVVARTRVEGQRVACVGDILSCPIHGDTPIQTGSPNWQLNGQKVARTGSVCACGAVIIGGATKTVTS